MIDLHLQLHIPPILILGVYVVAWPLFDQIVPLGTEQIFQIKLRDNTMKNIVILLHPHLLNLLLRSNRIRLIPNIILRFYLIHHIVIGLGIK